MHVPKICHIRCQDGPGGGPFLLVDHLAAMAGRLDPEVIRGGRAKVAAYCEIKPFAEKPLRLVGDAPLRKKMGEAGGVRAPEFSVARTAEQCPSLIPEVLSKEAVRRSFPATLEI
jgi:hypothetical protein